MNPLVLIVDDEKPTRDRLRAAPLAAQGDLVGRALDLALGRRGQRGPQTRPVAVPGERGGPRGHAPGDVALPAGQGQVGGQGGGGIVGGLVLANQAAQSLGNFPGARLKHRIGQHLVRVDGPSGRDEQK